MKQKGNSSVLVIIVMVLLVAGFYFFKIKPNKQFIPKSINEVGCIHSVTVQGDSMEPAIKSGAFLSMNKCISDKTNIEVGKVLLYKENSMQKLGRVKERLNREDGIFYKVTRDNRKGEEITISSEVVLATE